MKIQTWTTFRKNNNPEIIRIQDSTLGFISHIGKTLKTLGFKLIEIELAMGSDSLDINGGTPAQIVKDYVSKINCSEVVYDICRHSRGYCKYLNIYYR